MKWIVAAVAVVVVSSGVGLGVYFSATPGNRAHASDAGKPSAHQSFHPPVLVSSTPANGSASASGISPLTLRFSEPVDQMGARPVFDPPVNGTWTGWGSKSLLFTPSAPLVPGTTESVSLPVSTQSNAGQNSLTTISWKVADGSVVGLQELLATLGYLPLVFSPVPSPLTGAVPPVTPSVAFQPLWGSFTWSQSGWPASLASLWQVGQPNLVTEGAVMSFESSHGLATDGLAGPKVWAALYADSVNDRVSNSGFTYAVASETLPETLTVWHNGIEVVTTAANSGIPASPTPLGTWPVYERLASQTMTGTNPDGSHYSDPVSWVAYFHRGDAVHYIARSQFGYPQSLGCVEVPYSQGQTAWGYLTIGSLVTVTS